MRRIAAICLFLVFCCVSGVGQSQPQWVIVYSVVLFGQASLIPRTIAFTPSEENSVYRLSAVMSGSPGADEGFLMDWGKIDGSSGGISLGVGTQGTWLFTPKAGTPVAYLVVGHQGSYNLAFTIEQLQNSN